MQVFNDKVFNLVSPNISATFKIDVSMVSWVVTISSLIYGVGGALYSVLADRVPMRKLFVFGAVTFAVGSILGFTLQFSFFLVVLARAIQCIGSAVIPGCLVILIRRYVPKEKQPMYLGYSTAMYQISGGLGYAIGGYITDHFSWQSAFLIPILSLLLIPVLAKNLPDDSTVSDSKIDFFGAAFLAVTAGTLLFSVSKKNALIGLVGIVLVALFIVYSLKKKDAFIDLRVIKTKKFLPGMIACICTYAPQTAFFFLFPFAMKDSFLLSAAAIGIMFIPANFSAFGSGMISGKITEKLGRQKAFFLGSGTVVLSLILFTTMVGSNMMVMWVALWLFAVGYTIIYPSFYSAYTGAMPDEKVGRCMALSNLMNSICGSLAVAFTGLLISINVLNVKILPMPAGLNKVSIYSNMFLIFALSVSIGAFIYHRTFSMKKADVQEKKN